MFGRGQEIADLEKRVAEVEEHVGALAAQLGAAGRLLDDTRRLEHLAEQADRLSTASETTLMALRETAAGVGIGAPRQRARLNEVHRAERLSYVSAYFDGGYTDRIRLLAGADDPPTDCVCEANTQNDINSYAGMVVRPGEYWTAESSRGEKSGFVCVVTPLL